ncbi:hypothetical protein ACI5FR_05595 [Paenibacillus sp. HJGM_3]
MRLQMLSRENKSVFEHREGMGMNLSDYLAQYRVESSKLAETYRAYDF